MIIAVDFDGTIVEHKYPEIGEEIPFAFKTLKSLQALGHTLILWTFRSGKELNEAVDFCKKNGVEFYAVNNNAPDEIFDPSLSRKIYADLYIDDRNILGLPDWLTIYKMIKNT
ncbi:MAG: hydrolase [Prolixibacteraceae bacterium]|nr:hydrolase [Prolixibacteraceae bacterium]